MNIFHESKSRRIALTVATYLALPLALEQSDLMACACQRSFPAIYIRERIW